MASEKEIKEKLYNLRNKNVTEAEIKEIDKNIGKLLRSGYMPLYTNNMKMLGDDELLQKELEDKFDELFKSENTQIEKELKDMDIICEFMDLCKNNQYEFFKSRTFINFLKLSPINFYPYVKEYKIKENLKKYLKYINDTYLIVNADSIWGLINAMRLNRLCYADEITDLFEKYVEDFNILKIEKYIKSENELNEKEFWDFAYELNKYKLATGLLPKEVCEYIICESLNPKSQISLKDDFWIGLKGCAFCDYLTYEQIEKCDEGDYFNYTLLLDIARGEYSSFEKIICLDPYYIYKFSAEDTSALITLFHELEHLKQDVAKKNNNLGQLRYDMLKEYILRKNVDDFDVKKDLLLFSEMEARRLGYEGAISFLKENNVALDKLKSRAIASFKKLPLKEFEKTLDEDYIKCFFDKSFGRKRFNTNKRLSEVLKNNLNILEKNTILLYEFDEKGNIKLLKDVLKKIDFDLFNGLLDKENAKSILKSTLFDSIKVMEKTYRKRIEEVLTFEYSNKKIASICKNALKEKMQEMIYVLECSKDFKNKVEICNLLKGYLNN